MKLYNKFLELIKSKSEIDLDATILGVRSAIESGEIWNDPNMLLAISLFALAGLILAVCALLFIFKRPSEHALSDQDLFTIESRIQSLEIALSEQKNLILTLKNQNKADFGYFKQEMKDFYRTLEVLDHSQIRETQRLRAVG